MGELNSKYGELTGVADAPVRQHLDMPGIVPDSEPGKGNALYEYLKNGTINGAPVAPEDKGLAVDSDELLQSAFQLVRRPCFKLLRLSPDDKESQHEYNEVLDRVYDGSVYIVDEDRQFDAAHGGFVVWLRYDELCYKLLDRFGYLRNEQ